MNNESISKWRKILTQILLIQILILVCTITQVQAPTIYRVTGEHDGSAIGTIGRMYIEEQDVAEYSVVASCVFLIIDSDQWIACGIFQGDFPYDNTIVDVPWYYWDWRLPGHFPDGDPITEATENYNTFQVNILPIGEEYWMYFGIGNDYFDYQIVDYYSLGKVLGQAESQFSGNDMDFHHKYMKYRTSYGLTRYFDDTKFERNSPYTYYIVSDTEWYSFK